MADGRVIDQAHGKDWTLWHGDCVEIARALPAESLHYSVYSPPFISLYTFSDDPRDMSNNAADGVFWEHYRFLLAELYRAMMPGRLCSVHCMNLPTSKLRDGYIGLRDFRGEIIRAHQEAGFIYHAETVIRKDPVSAMQRTKSIGLLHKQMVKDSALSRMAVPDYVVTFRKPGANPEPIAGLLSDEHLSERLAETYTAWDGARQQHTDVSKSIAVWQRYAEPIWTDINQGDVLSHRMTREEADEAHIAPLQLTVIRRCVDLWSNPGDTVFSPFAGIGSEGYVALQMGRRFVGAELKASYWRQACRYLDDAAKASAMGNLFEARA